MPRGSAKKVLATRRPVDVFKILQAIPAKYVYCFKLQRLRRRDNGQLVSNATWPNPFHTKKKASDRLEALREQRNARLELKRKDRDRAHEVALKEYSKRIAAIEADKKLSKEGKPIVRFPISMKKFREKLELHTAVVREYKYEKVAS